MKFLCVVYEEPNNGLGPQTEQEAQELVNEHLNYDETLRQSGHWLIAQALQPVETATTVRVRNGKTSITDGPFAETKELLGGFILIEAKDMEEAVQLAAGIPSARMGFIHVRKVLEFEKK